MDRRCKTVIEPPKTELDNKKQKCRRKRTRTRSRLVKLNKMEEDESLEITQRVKLKKQRIQCTSIINVTKISENNLKDSKLRKRCTHKKDKQSSKKCHGTKIRKHKAECLNKRKTSKIRKTDSRSFDASKSSEKNKTDISSFDKHKTMYKQKTDSRSYDTSKISKKYKTDSRYFDTSKSSKKDKTDSSSFDKRKHLNKRNLSSFDTSKDSAKADINPFNKLNSSGNKNSRKSFHDCRTKSPGLNRIVPQCMRGECRSHVLKTCKCQIRKVQRKLKKIRDKEDKEKHGLYLSPISSSSLRECEISYENISSDSFTSYEDVDDYDIGSKINKLIKRTKRDKRKQHRFDENENLRPISTSTPKRSDLAKQLSGSENSIEIKENSVETICIDDSDDDSSVNCHSVHSQATLVLGQEYGQTIIASPNLREKVDLLDPQENYIMYSMDLSSNHTYSPSISPIYLYMKNEHFRNSNSSYTPCLDAGRTSYSPAVTSEYTKHEIDKHIEDDTIFVSKQVYENNTSSDVSKDPRVRSRHSKCAESSIVSTLKHKQEVYCEDFQNAVNKIKYEIQDYENIKMEVSSENHCERINKHEDITSNQNYSDIQSNGYYYHQRMQP